MMTQRRKNTSKRGGRLAGNATWPRAARQWPRRGAAGISSLKKEGGKPRWVSIPSEAFN